MTDQTEATQTEVSNTPDSIIKLDAERQISTNFFWRKEVEGQTFDLQTTLRDQPSEVEVLNHMEAVGMAMRAVMTRGGIAKNVGNAPQMQSVVGFPTHAPATQDPVAAVADAPPPAHSAPAAASAVPQQAPLNLANPNSFMAELLKVTSVNGELQFKVFGGKYRKYGVRVWPEVVASAFKIEAMEIKDYSLAGYVAHYELNESGQPKKVTRLEHVGE